MKTPLLLLLRAYKLGVSPFLGQNCRFYPSCSDYAAQAVSIHGAFKGSVLAARRLGKCHPWHAGGLDPVPGSVEADLLRQEADPASTVPNSSSQRIAARVPPAVAADGCSHS
ncbi:membrane protein insertion efficiency factor YidD [Herbaspirillum sp. alder98]|uniref:membrane protein insertion efficiency factor YidD n=1 Tax=Herbaspirillum sp. alder98 TaxID=2913096 RepID=UPI001CD8C369|nr:membrane protein insertion efficiency factor YidD [Herbaspirillum sp. alder98]MCA1326173.1 membrane protein insertion efficiency factor YidD [Herbaspirillum sp. alder98]